jgi:hypothetical protein
MRDYYRRQLKSMERKAEQDADQKGMGLPSARNLKIPP